MALFQTKIGSLNDKKTIIDALKGMKKFYHDATLKNHDINKPKIQLYKYIKWPERYKSSITDKANEIKLVPVALDKQIKAFTIALNSLRKLKSFIASKATFKDAPPIYTRYVQLVETMILETEREVDRLIPLFKEQKSLIKSAVFKDFDKSDLEKPEENAKYQEFVHLFDQERAVYKILTTVGAQRYQQYTQMEKQLEAYARELEREFSAKAGKIQSYASTFATFIQGVATAGAMIMTIYIFFLNGGFENVGEFIMGAIITGFFGLDAYLFSDFVPGAMITGATRMITGDSLKAAQLVSQCYD